VTRPRAVLYDRRMLILRSSRLLPVALAAAMGLSAAPARAEGESRWLAAVPFGAGQFQNGDVGLGIFFAAAEGTFGATSIATVVAVNLLASRDVGPDPRGAHRASLNKSIHTLTVANGVAFTGFALLAVSGVIEAQVNFTRKTRRLPAIVPVAAPIPGGALLAARGTF
jgi:hypothetical protein